MPSRTELEEYGLDDDEIADIQASFEAVPRVGVHGTNAQGHEIESLLRDYDCSRVEVGPVRLLPSTIEHPEGVVFGHCEADPLVMSDDGSIDLFDHASGERSLACARTSERFLDALAAFLRIQAARDDWRGRPAAAAAQCAAAAGGDTYRAFYGILTGFLDQNKES